MPRLVASSASSGRNDFFAGAGVAVAALSAGAEARAAIGHASAARHSARRDGAKPGRVTVAAGAPMSCGGSGGRTQSRGVRPPTSYLRLTFHRGRGSQAAKDRAAHHTLGDGLAGHAPANGLARNLAAHGLANDAATNRLARDLATHRLAGDLAAHGPADSPLGSATTCHHQHSSASASPSQRSSRGDGSGLGTSLSAFTDEPSRCASLRAAETPA